VEILLRAAGDANADDVVPVDRVMNAVLRVPALVEHLQVGRAVDGQVIARVDIAEAEDVLIMRPGAATDEKAGDASKQVLFLWSFLMVLNDDPIYTSRTHRRKVANLHNRGGTGPKGLSDCRNPPGKSPNTHFRSR